MFPCFEGIRRVRFVPPHDPPQHAITGVGPLHEQVIRLLGPSCATLYALSACACAMRALTSCVRLTFLTHNDQVVVDGIQRALAAGALAAVGGSVLAVPYADSPRGFMNIHGTPYRSEN